MNNIDISTFQEAFIKQASEHLDCDENVLRGYLKYADEQFTAWQTIINQVPEYKNPEIRKQAAYEFLAASSLNKQANPITVDSIRDMLTNAGDSIGDTVGNFVGKPGMGGAGLGGAAIGGGGGGLIGLLLAKLLGLSPAAGMALGALLGSGAGYLFGKGGKGAPAPLEYMGYSNPPPRGPELLANMSYDKTQPLKVPEPTPAAPTNAFGVSTDVAYGRAIPKPKLLANMSYDQSQPLDPLGSFVQQWKKTQKPAVDPMPGFVERNKETLSPMQMFLQGQGSKTPGKR